MLKCTKKTPTMSKVIARFFPRFQVSNCSGTGILNLVLWPQHNNGQGPVFQGFSPSPRCSLSQDMPGGCQNEDRRSLPNVHEEDHLPSEEDAAESTGTRRCAGDPFVRVLTAGLGCLSHCGTVTRALLWTGMSQLRATHLQVIQNTSSLV